MIVLLILATISFAFMAFGPWNKGWAKENYKTGFIPFMPKNLPAYIFAYRAMAILFIIYFALASTLLIAGIPGENIGHYLIFGGILVFLMHRVLISWFTDDYMELYEKKVFEGIVHDNPHAYSVAQRVINLSLFLIVALIYILVITGVIFGD
jgi:hypothetical protein